MGDRRLMSMGALGAIALGLPYLLRSFGPTEAEVVTWGWVCLCVGVLLSVLLLVDYTHGVVWKRIVLGLGFLTLALLQLLPIILWVAFHGSGISDGSPPAMFVAHWGYGMPHLVLLAVSVAVVYHLAQRRAAR